MRKLFAFLLCFSLGFFTARAEGPTDGEDLLRKVLSVVEETAQQNAAQANVTDKRMSYASVMPQPDEKNVVITFTVNADNKIHVVNVQGGYAYINHYIKSSLEGKQINTDNAIPGINYVMTIKLPTTV